MVDIKVRVRSLNNVLVSSRWVTAETGSYILILICSVLSSRTHRCPVLSSGFIKFLLPSLRLYYVNVVNFVRPINATVRLKK